MDSYSRIDFEWLPLRKFGENVMRVTYEEKDMSVLASYKRIELVIQDTQELRLLRILQ